MLGCNSLQVFAAHIPVRVRTDRLLGPPCASGPTALAQGTFVALMLTVMLFVTWRSGLHPMVGRPGQRQASSERSGELARGAATGGAMTRPGCQDRRPFRRS